MKPMLLTSAALSLLAISPALAGQAEHDPYSLNMRLRHETVDQDGLPETASALTLRTRFGLQTPPRDGVTFLVEAENTVHLIDNFADTVAPRPGYPVVADPEVTELNRFQIDWRGDSGVGVTIGRQWFVMDDQRFAGPVGFRQNSQSVDAIRLRSGHVWPVALDYAYIDRVHRIFGDDHPAGEFDSASHAAEARGETPLGTLSAFGLLLDFENAPGLSSQTYGLRLTGTHEAVAYRLEYARQFAHAGNTASFELDYLRVEGDYDAGHYTVGGGIEILGGDGITGFQTPLATLHKFQGAADVFLNTPADGLRDIYLRGQWSFPHAVPGPLSLGFAWHDFASDDGGTGYGSEIDLVAGLSLTERVSAEAKAAVFDGDAGGPVDRTKIWLSLVFDY
ncbi:hypothetical protein [Maricaulis sp.]|uniref:hypothetical protein n=1 Tax=Maricaulis sp. TaxID=1486257 RepID=UPI002639F83D|nr:hypothetical protein [Maricaulis sp.]